MKTFVLLTAIAAVLLTGCSSFDTSSDYDPATDFLRYRTFAVKKDAKIPGDVLAENDFTQKRVFAAIESVLMSKGLRMVSPDEAELIVMSYAGVKDKVNLNTYGYATGGYWGRYGYGYPGGMAYSTQTVATHYTEGTLHIDILDQTKKELVWKGWGTGVISDARSPQEREQLIGEAVTEVLDNFPPH